jgi:hypothetical protein
MLTGHTRDAICRGVIGKRVGGDEAMAGLLHEILELRALDVFPEPVRAPVRLEEQQ